MEKGKLFVIDGTDGSGKQTQLQKLKERFDKEGIEYRTVSFPNYDSPSSSLVKMYLAGSAIWWPPTPPAVVALPTSRPVAYRRYG